MSIGKVRVRMRDVANRCGVSISTVSLVLSGDTRIPEDTTRKVLQTVKAMEYRPSVIARSLAKRGSRTVGVILPEWAFTKNQAFYYQALQGIHAQTQGSGYKIVVEAANRSFLERRYYLRLLKEQSADGLIYMAAGFADGYLNDMSKESYPFVLLGGTVDRSDLATVCGDDFLGAKMATQHLLSLGHKKIGFVSPIKHTSLGRDRSLGYEEAMKAANIVVDPQWSTNGDSDIAKAEGVVDSLLSAGVTAIFAAGDVMAFGVLQALKKKNIRVPHDIAVVGMDDIELSSWFNPQLTTVRYDIAQMGSLAAQRVITKIQSPVGPKLEFSEPAKPTLVIRESCGGKIPS